jgi:hypothetical protein
MNTRRLGWFAAVVCLLGTVGMLGCTKSAPPAAPVTPTAVASAYFADRTASSGIDLTYRNGQEAGHFAILESLGGGVGLLDYDQDGLLDIYATGGGYYDGPDKQQIKGLPNKLYKNLGNWKFKDVTR